MRRAILILTWCVLVLIGLPLLLAGILFLTANTGIGRGLIERGAAWLSAGQVQLEGLSGRFPDHLQARQLTLRDARGAWLSADGLALDWRPWELLGRRLHLTRLAAAQVELLRRPEASGPPEPRARPRAANNQWRLPLTIQIDRFELPHVQLDAALAGSAVTLRLQGGGRYLSLQRAALRLDAQRLDTAGSSYRLSAQLAPRRDALQLDLQEGAQGPLANLLRLPRLGALTLHAQLNGPLRALATSLVAQVGTLQARAAGTLDLPDRSATLDLTLASQAMAPRAGLAWRRAALTARVRGPFTAPTTDARLELVGLSWGALQLDTLRAELRGVGGGLALDATLAGLTLPAPVHTLLHQAPLTVQGQISLAPLAATAGATARADTLDLTLSHPLLQAHARYGFGAAAATGGTLTVTLPQLAPWAALAHLRLQGRGTLEGRLADGAAGAQLALSAALDVSGGEPGWTALLGPHTDLSATLGYSGDGVRLERARLAAANLTASAQGEERGGALDVGWRFALPSLGTGSAGVTGSLRAQGRLQGELPRLTLSASADADLSVRRSPAMLHLSLQGRDLPQRPSGRFAIDGALAGAPLALDVSLQPGADGAFALQLQRAGWKSVQFAGALRFARGMPLAPQGRLSLRITQLADLDPLLGAPLTGSVDASVAFVGAATQERARLLASATGLALPSAQVEHLQLRGEVDQPLTAPRLTAQLGAEASLRGVPARLAVRVDGPLAALRLRVAATTVVATAPTGGAAAGVGTGTGAGTGAATGARAAAAAATVPNPRFTAGATWYQAQRALRLTALNARYRGQSLRLMEPALVSLRSGISVDRLRLAFGPAMLQLEGRIGPQLALRASVRDLTPQEFGFIVPQLRALRAQGRIDAQLELRGDPRAPDGRFTLTAGGLASASGAARALPPGAIKVSAQLAGGAAKVDATVDAGERMQLRASGSLPLRRDVPMDLKLDGRMDLTLANSLLEAGGQRVLGELGIQAQLSGTPASPQARGQLTLMHVGLQDYALGLSVSDLNATLAATGAQVQLQQLSAHAGSGTLSASGSVDLSRPGLPLQLQLTARNAQPLKSDLLTADLNADLRVSGELLWHELAASGTVRINKATINIPNALPPSVAQLKVVRPGQQAPPPPTPQRPLFAMLNLAVNAPTGIFVRGRGLNVEVGGTVHATGTSTSPNIAGGFDLVNGTFDLAGSTLTFTTGRLSFNGTGLRHRIDPTLDFTATTYSGGIAATLTVGGYADAPVITLSSSPQQLPQDEVLARLLFGESVAQLSPLQIAGIGAALVTMTGAGGGGFNPLTAVQHVLGLNRLAISGGSGSTGVPTSATGSATQTNTGATIEAGRYLSNRIYVGAKQSTNGLTQAQVQVDLTRQWKLQTTLSSGGGTVQGATPENDPGSSVGMSYQFEY